MANPYQALSQSKALKPAFDRLWSLKQWAKRTIRAQMPDPHIDNFIRHNEEKFAKTSHPDSNSVVLVSQHDWAPSIYTFSLTANAIAAHEKARIETFDFSDTRSPRAEKIYRSFGAKRALSSENTAPYADKAEKLAEEIFSGLKTKWDVMNIRIEGELLGDVIYDTYLRQLVQATVTLNDPRLKVMILDAVKIFYACREYFDTRKVVAVMSWRTVYLKHGIVARMAMNRGIPAYLIPYRPFFFLLGLDPTLSTGMCNPTKRFPYYRYRQVFEKLSPQEQAAGRAWAKDDLAGRLSGKYDPGILIGRTAYHAPTTGRILAETSKPKILILLHDYCDAVHSFRRMLFPDFYEWSKFTFARASETDFEWYAKPHPNSITSSGKNILNDNTIAELSAAYPKIKILDAGVSNLQLVQEGIVAAFTVHGTAGHEFASMGVNVVNAGDNLHVDFDFNLNPKTVEEYTQCIDKAGHLGHTVNQEDVAAFYYMHYSYCRKNNRAEANPVDDGWRDDPEFNKKGRTQSAFSYFLKTETPEKIRVLDEYFTRCLTKNKEALTVRGL